MSGLQPGDVVSVESGRHRGCLLTYVGWAAGWHVCLTSHEPGGYVRVSDVRFVRHRALTFDPATDDRVMFDDWRRRIAFAQEMTGAQAATPRLCSICRTVHGPEIQHACE